MISIQTNYASLVGDNNLNTNAMFQTKTIESLTSGYRINSSGDDPAGLATANQFRSSVTELTQGVINANFGVSNLQIVDGGLSNISTMLDRMKTLATESASTLFQGNRSTLDQEYQTLKGEITRQATNIGLVAGGANAAKQSVYIGGSPTGGGLSSAAVNIDLSSALVDAGSLGLATSTVGTGGSATTLGGGPKVSSSTPITVANAAFTVYTAETGSAGKTVNLSGTTTGSQFVADINSQLAGTGVTADINASSGQVEFQGGAFSIGGLNPAAASLIGGGPGSYTNSSMYTGSSAVLNAGTTTAAQNLDFTVGGQKTVVTLAAGLNGQQVVDAINSQMNSQGVYAVFDATAGTVNFEGSSPFSVASETAGATQAFTAAVAVTSAAPTGTAQGSATSNATAAISAINSALATIGTVQGTVGAGENDLQYAINLANSQITNFDSAQSQLRDADVATEAANLTKAQVMQQASVAAMAQANSAPQALLKLLQ